MNQDEAKNFLASLERIPLTYREVAEEFIDKLNAAIKILWREPSVRYSTENLPHEIWRDVVGYEGLYQVSNFGCVKSFQHNYPKIIRADEQSKGYLQLRLHLNRNSKNLGVHILVARAFISNPEEKPGGDHRNGDKTNNCVWNLGWGTRSENATRAYQLVLIKVNRGTQCHYAKLTAEEVICIRENPEGLKSRKFFANQHFEKLFSIKTVNNFDERILTEKSLCNNSPNCLKVSQSCSKK